MSALAGAIVSSMSSTESIHVTISHVACACGLAHQLAEDIWEHGSC